MKIVLMILLFTWMAWDFAYFMKTGPIVMDHLEKQQIDRKKNEKSWFPSWSPMPCKIRTRAWPLNHYRYVDFSTLPKKFIHRWVWE